MVKNCLHIISIHKGTNKKQKHTTKRTILKEPRKTKINKDAHYNNNTNLGARFLKFFRTEIFAIFGLNFGTNDYLKKLTLKLQNPVDIKSVCMPMLPRHPDSRILNDEKINKIVTTYLAKRQGKETKR